MIYIFDAEIGLKIRNLPWIIWRLSSGNEEDRRNNRAEERRRVGGIKNEEGNEVGESRAAICPSINTDLPLIKMRNTVTRDHYGPCRSHKPAEPINYIFRILVSSLRAALDRSGRPETISVLMRDKRCAASSKMKRRRNEDRSEWFRRWKRSFLEPDETETLSFRCPSIVYSRFYLFSWEQHVALSMDSWILINVNAFFD